MSLRLLHARTGVLIRPADGASPTVGSIALVASDDLTLFSFLPTGLPRSDATAIDRADAAAQKNPPRAMQPLELSSAALQNAMSFPLLDLRLFSFQLPDTSPYVGLSLYAGMNILHIATAQNPTYTVLPASSPLAGGSYTPPAPKYRRPDAPPPKRSDAENAEIALLRAHHESGIGKVLGDFQFGILERFAKITKSTQNRAVDLLEAVPAARQAVGLLPQEYVAKVLPAEEAAKIAEDFEPARNYINHFAEDVLLGKGKETKREDGSDFQMEDLPAEETELGDFEVVEFDDMPLEWRNHHRTGMPIAPEDFLSWFDKEGRLEKSEEKIREHVFYSGIDMDIRPSLWPFLLGVYKWTSTEAERLEVKTKHNEEYFELERQWKALLRPSPSAGSSPALNGEQLPAIPSTSANAVLSELKTELQAPGTVRSPTAGDEAEGQDLVSALRERRYRIEKDVVRTDRNIPFFAGDRTKVIEGGREEGAGDASDASSAFAEFDEDEAPPNIPGVSVAGWNTNLAILRDILVTYAYREFSLGYVQGMSDLLAPVLAVVRDEVEAFWCFVGFMEFVKANFARDQVGMRTQLLDLERLVKFLDPKLHNHLERIDGLNFFFCFRWLLIWFKREFDFTDIMRLWEVLWSRHLTAHFHLFFAVAILQWKREELLACKAFDELLKCINELNGKIPMEETLELAELLFFKFRFKLAKWERDPSSVHLPFDSEGNSEISAREKARSEPRRAPTETEFTLPKLDGPVLDAKLLSKCGLVWKKANNWLVPDGAIESGGEYMDQGRKKGRQLFICRAGGRRGLYPGKGPLGSYLLGGCNYSCGGKELSSAAYEVLCLDAKLRRNAMLRGSGDPVASIRDYAMHRVLDWMPSSGALVDTTGCVSGGCVDADGEPLYVARAFYKDGVHVGWVKEGDERGISIGWGGHEVRCEEYEILKVQGPPQEDDKPVEEKLVELDAATEGKNKEALRVETGELKVHWVTTLKKLLEK
ncbi:hypothetical protein DFJ74DRAFT_710868 [Hyaloraphidium curvatum]|nr:hypothetical protein DFJ74DRAFT_710868 [Hyaloraphidium curvatum]